MRKMLGRLLFVFLLSGVGRSASAAGDDEAYFSAAANASATGRGPPFEPPRLRNISPEEFSRFASAGWPVIVTDVSRDWPMRGWTCDSIGKTFPGRKMRRERDRGLPEILCGRHQQHRAGFACLGKIAGDGDGLCKLDVRQFWILAGLRNFLRDGAVACRENHIASGARSGIGERGAPCARSDDGNGLMRHHERIIIEDCFSENRFPLFEIMP